MKHKYKLFNGVDAKQDLTLLQIEQRQQCWDEKQQLKNQGIFKQIKFINNTPTLVGPPFDMMELVLAMIMMSQRMSTIHLTPPHCTLIKGF